MEAFQKLNQETAGIYVFNRGCHAHKKYESLNREIRELYDHLTDLMAEKWLLTEKISTFSYLEIPGAIATESPVIDKKDGWQ